MAAVKIKHEEREPMQLSRCPPYEINAFAQWVMYKMTMEDRQELMATLPGVYSRLVGIQMTITVGKEPGEP